MRMQNAVPRPGSLFTRDGAAEQLDRALDDREAETDPLEAARRSRLDLLKIVEDDAEIFGRDADARVAHVRHHRVAVVLFHRELDLAALGGELHGVRGEVEHDLLVLAAIEPHAALDARAHVTRRFLSRAKDADRILHLGQHRARVELVHAQLGATRLDLREIEHVVDEQLQILRAAHDRLHRALLLLARPRRRRRRAAVRRSRARR